MHIPNFNTYPKAFLFDLGGTLVNYVGLPLNWTNYYPAAFDRVSSKLGLRLNDTAIKDATLTLNKYNARINPREVEYSSTYIFSEATATWNLRSHSVDEVAMCFYSFFQENMQIFPDAKVILRIMGEKGIKTGILTDLATGMPDEIALEGISALNCKIDCVITSSDVGFRKPNKTGYIQLASRLGVQIEDCVFIGDEDKDIVGANHAGMVSDFSATGGYWGYP